MNPKTIVLHHQGQPVVVVVVVFVVVEVTLVVVATLHTNSRPWPEDTLGR